MAVRAHNNSATQPVIFFDGSDGLRQLTGLSDEELWNAGFDLDDMDFGIMTNIDWEEHLKHYNSPFYESWLLDMMDNYCVGYKHTAYNGKHYYTVHHS